MEKECEVQCGPLKPAFVVFPLSLKSDMFIRLEVLDATRFYIIVL